MDSRKAIEYDLKESIAGQSQAVVDWHENEPKKIDATVYTDGAEQLKKLVLAQHFMNFKLWHVEDTARRKDVDSSVIAECKYSIDTLNQQRNDAFERVDQHLVERLTRFIPAPESVERVRHNTESLGMAIDRLSIMALKIYHMAEQTQRDDVDDAHRQSCSEKLAVLKEQRADLVQAVFDLIDDFCAGIKRPKTYYQFKMYNDPHLNPELYKNT